MSRAISPQENQANIPRRHHHLDTGWRLRSSTAIVCQHSARYPGSPDGQGTQIYVSSAGVRQIQQALNQRGYAAGHLDGNWSNDTAIAATHFQQAQGLEPTGTLTTNLLATVGMSRGRGGEFMGGMTARASTPGNPNSETTGSFTSASGRNTSASSVSDGGSSTRSDASAPQDRRDTPASGTR